MSGNELLKQEAENKLHQNGTCKIAKRAEKMLTKRRAQKNMITKGERESLTIIPFRLWTPLLLQFLRWNSQFRPGLRPKSIHIFLFRR